MSPGRPTPIDATDNGPARDPGPRNLPIMRDTSVVQINLTAVEHNAMLLRRLIGPQSGLCPVLKADAYGLGAVRIARRLSGQAAMFAVYTPEQATELVRAAIISPILVLMPVWDIDRTDELYRAFVSGRLHLTVHGVDHLERIIEIAEKFGAVAPVHLEIDTGMSRGGAAADEAGALLKRIAGQRRLRLAGVFTHFSSAETDLASTDAQLARFDALLREFNEFIPDDCLVHCANTYATLRSPRFHRRMVRIGLAWAGFGLESIEGGEIVTEGEELRPAVTWSSRIVHVKSIVKGTTVGYNATWTAPRDSRIALIPVGYADGYPMFCGERNDDGATTVGAQVGVILETSRGVRRAFAPVVGAVNMDQITIDVTELPAGAVGVGTEVELISPDALAPNHAPKLAAMAETIPHEMLTRLNPRVRRVYLVKPTEIESVLNPAALAV